MKIKLSNKEVKTCFENIKMAGYCELQHLLRGQEPFAYTCGTYGWNYDVYKVNGVTICTGYRNMPGTRVQGATEFETRARAIWENYTIPYEQKQEQAAQLLKEFCVLNGGY